MNKPHEVQVSDRDRSDNELDAQPDDSIIDTAFRRSLLVILVVAMGVGSLVWLTKKQVSTANIRQTEVIVPQVPVATGATIPPVPFTDVTGEAGITFVHQNGAYGDKLLPEIMGGGCAFFDFDHDGDQDLLLVNSCYWPQHAPKDEPPPTMALYQNDGTGHFADVTAGSGLDETFYGMGVAVGDFDNDGWVDVFISAVGSNRLFRNESGRFAEVTDLAGVAGGDSDYSSSCGWLDIDNDGDLDLFVCNYVGWSKDFDLALDARLKGLGRTYAPPDQFGGTFSYLYRNDGNGEFTDVSAAAGLQLTTSAGAPMAKSLGVAPVDVDGDGWIDLIVANDTVQNFLFHNQQDGTFQEIGGLSGIAFDSQGKATGAMGADSGWFRNNDSLGLAFGNFSNEMTALYVSLQGTTMFSDEAIATGLGPETLLELTFGVFFFDCDLDGRLDMFAANGHLHEEIHSVQESQHFEQPPQLFWNCGPQEETEFLAVPAEKCGEDFFRPMLGRGAAFADIDGDGDLDILIAATGRAPRLLRNDQHLGRHWLRLKLTGTKSNRDAIGAWIEVRIGDQRLRRQVMPTRSYLSQSELPVTIGLGQTTQPDRITIHWPSGSVQEIKQYRIDGLTHVVEERAAQSSPQASAP